MAKGEGKISNWNAVHLRVQHALRINMFTASLMTS